MTAPFFFFHENYLLSKYLLCLLANTLLRAHQYKNKNNKREKRDFLFIGFVKNFSQCESVFNFCCEATLLLYWRLSHQGSLGALKWRGQSILHFQLQFLKEIKNNIKWGGGGLFFSSVNFSHIYKLPPLPYQKKLRCKGVPYRSSGQQEFLHLKYG